MKLALLSDIHANIHALDACLAHAATNKVTQYAFLGDLVGYGGHPAAVLDCVMHMVVHQGAIAVMGNHDQMAIKPPDKVERVGDESALWTHQQLSIAHVEFLSKCPPTAQIETCFLVHASADAPEKWRYVDDTRSAERSLDAACALADVRYVFGGHVHQQMLYFKGQGRDLMPFIPVPGIPIPTPRHRRWIATVGSVGQPRDGKPLAMYAIFDLAQSTLCFHRVSYNHMAAALAVRQAGLPEYFAQRLEQGR
jgi:diadenosine tetraphosphatase ApaH/serine/threonine PP2A family protein phosphatase